MERESMEDVLHCSGWSKGCKGDEEGAGRTWCVNCGKDG